MVAGLILVGAGLIFLYFHARKKPIVVKVTVRDNEVIIEATGPAEVVDNPRLQELFQKAIERKAAQAPPPHYRGPKREPQTSGRSLEHDVDPLY